MNASVLATIVQNSLSKEFQYNLFSYIFVIAFLWAEELAFFRFLIVDFSSSEKY